MCKDRTLSSELDAGFVRVLCNNRQKHLLKLIGLEGRPDPQPAKALFEALSSRATIVVAEYDYFDVDYRSEFSAVHQHSFQARYPSAVRLHFFGGRTLKTRRPLDGVVRARSGDHLGYTVIRIQRPGTIGRAMVSPPAAHTDLIDGDTLARHVRIAVPETIQVFGVPITTIGVPFMEQDGHLMRCAHVSAWMCHYAAVLRGMVVRRPSAEFHTASGTGVFSYGRGYPSLGLTTSALSTIASNLDLPPEILDQESLRQNRDLAWQDYDGIRQAVKAANSLRNEDKRQIASDRLWTRENFTSAICRYLNSGIPSIVCRERANHTQVVVGYLREEDLKAGDNPEAATPGHSDVQALIVNDDQAGPYLIVKVEDVLEEILSGSTSVIVPLPRGLSMPGSIAEGAAVHLFREIAKERLAAMQEKGPTDGEDITTLQDFVQGLDDAASGNLTVRTYAALGTDFKESFAHRIKHAKTSRLLNLQQLPKYVWVSEVIDRALRNEGQPSVRGTVVLDASTPATDNTEYSDIPALFMHLLDGATTLIPAPPNRGPEPNSDEGNQGGENDNHDDEDEQVQQNDVLMPDWTPSTTVPYYTGRWTHEREEMLKPLRVASRSKTASPGH